MILFGTVAFALLLKGVSCGQCFQCDSTNYASCRLVTCPSNMCQTRTALNGMVSYMCWSGTQAVSPGCTNSFGEKVCVCSGDRCNNAGINNSNASGGNDGNIGTAGWGNNNGMNGNSAGWGNWGNGNTQNGNSGGNWKDWGNNQAQNWGKGNGYSSGNNGNCDGNGNSTGCQGNGSSGLNTLHSFLIAVTLYFTAEKLYK